MRSFYGQLELGWSGAAMSRSAVDVVHRFERSERIGGGSYGEVFRGWVPWALPNMRLYTSLVRCEWHACQVPVDMAGLYLNSSS